LPPIQKKEHTWDPIERAEGILTAFFGADIHHNGGSRAFYRPLTDSIHLPDKGQFPTAENYYATALHELGHWSGHEDRLNRDLVHPFGSEGYAKEELRAEIASMILGDELGIGHDPSQHAAYVGSWIKALKDDPMEIFRAAADAEKIQTYVLGLELKHVQDQAVQQNQAQGQPVTDAYDNKVEAISLNALKAYELTSDEFSKIATATPLVNHGRKWEVFAGEQSYGFSDGETAGEAINEAHKRHVNNALYSLSAENTGAVDVRTMPPLRVLNEYPDLVEKFSGSIDFSLIQDQSVHPEGCDLNFMTA
jgi:hypothetical protein